MTFQWYNCLLFLFLILGAIESVFSRLGFKVKVFDNLTAAKMLKVVEDLGKMNHFDADALVRWDKS